MKTSGCTIEILDRFNISVGCFMPSFPILASTKDDVNWRQRVKFLRTKTSKIPTKVRLLVSLGFGRVSCVKSRVSCVKSRAPCVKSCVAKFSKFVLCCRFFSFL